MLGKRVRRGGGGKRPSPKLNLWWWKSTLIVACRYSSVIIVQCPGGTVSVSGLSILSHLNHKGKRRGTELWLMSGRADWFWLSVRACKSLVMHVCVRGWECVCAFYAGACEKRRSTAYCHCWRCGNNRLLAKCRWKTFMRQQGTWNMEFKTVKTPSGRTTLDDPVRRPASLDLW